MCEHTSLYTPCKHMAGVQQVCVLHVALPVHYPAHAMIVVVVVWEAMQMLGPDNHCCHLSPTMTCHTDLSH